MAIIDAKKIFSSRVEFQYGANSYEQITSHHFPEIALIGASNSGKSSLINAIFHQKIAIVSSTPGRTRQLNFFKVSGFRDGFLVVDMPGYGFARAAQKDVEHWQNLCYEYFEKRPNLQRVFLLIDGLKGIKSHDYNLMQTLQIINLPFQIVLTKIDKINLQKQGEASLDAKNQVKQFSLCCDEIILVSSDKGYGIYDLQNAMLSVLQGL